MSGRVREEPVGERGPANPWATRVWWLTVAILIVSAVLVGLRPRRGADFRVYLTAAQRFLEGTDLYRAADGFMPFKYAPATASLFVPFTLLPTKVAVALWNVCSVLALAFVARFAARGFHREGDSAPWAWAPVVATAALLPAFAFELFYGQVDVALLLLLTLAAVGAERGWVWWPAAAFAVAVLLKPPAAVAGLYFVMRRRWGVIGASAVVMAMLFAPVVARYGWDGTVAQTRMWGEILARSTAPWALAANAQGLPTLLMSFLFPPQSIPPSGAMLVAQVLAICMFVGGVLWARPGPRDLLAVCCLGVALLSPQAWRANFVLAWPLMHAATRGRSTPNVIAAASIGLLGVLVSDSGLGLERSIRILYWRPFAVAYSLFLAGFLWQVRREGSARAMGVPRRRAERQQSARSAYRR